MALGWSVALLAVAAYCVVQIVRDIRDRAWGMVAFGIACLAILLFVPLQPVSITLPIAQPAPHGR